ncbi:MAG: hypothetical protein ABL888_14490 [Pirellulaceae bacterium]
MNDYRKTILFVVVFVCIVLGGLYLIGAKEAEFNVATTVRGKASDVFPFLTDPAKRLNWCEGLKSCKLLDSESVDSGSKYECTVNKDGKDYPVVESVKLIDQDKVFTVYRELSGIASTRIFELSEVNNQTTVSYRYLEKRDVLASLTFFLNRRNLEPSMFSEMEKLKTVVEANSAQASLDTANR